ncbi:MAG TPA: alkylhydroperoxidase-related (seleno)protein [Gammaproteobacteria bacterium]|jgi:hypothetical protein|nr:alkylhydroperoxidase-related (seleno)protein [Gammaproteobacteria bacterium]
MTLYSDSKYPVRNAIVEAHQHTLASFSVPGTWWTGAQRAAIVAEARDARCEAGLQKPAAAETKAPTDLPESTRRVARQVAVSTNKLDRGFFEQAVSDGLSDAEYVETVGVAARLTCVDVFARGIGVPSAEIAQPADGEPTSQRPATARDEGAWAESIPGGRRGKQEAIDTYGTDMIEAAPFIYRSLSLVPEEAKGLIGLGSAQYVALEEFMNFDFRFDPGFSRSQVELVAGRISAINECFY